MKPLRTRFLLNRTSDPQMGMSALAKVANLFLSSRSPLASLPAPDPVLRISMTMKTRNPHGLGVWKKKRSSSVCALTVELGFCSQLGEHWDRWKGWGCCKLKAKELAFCSLFAVRGYSGKQKSKRKYSLRWAEIGQNVMRHKWNKKKKKRKKEKEKKKGKRESFFTRRGSFLKTASNYNTFHIWFTPGSYALLPKTKTLFITLQGETEAHANSPEFGDAWLQECPF